MFFSLSPTPTDGSFTALPAFEEFYASRAQATSTSHGRSAPRRLRSSARANAAAFQPRLEVAETLRDNGDRDVSQGPSKTIGERTQALVLYDTVARAVRAPDYPFGPTPEQWREQLREVREHWGEREYFERQAREGFGAAADEDLVQWFVECQRFCASPGAAVTLYRIHGETDIRDVVPAIRVPILPPYYSLRLLPYAVPQIATWKRRMLREKDLTDAMF